MPAARRRCLLPALLLALAEGLRFSGVGTDDVDLQVDEAALAEELQEGEFGEDPDAAAWEWAINDVVQEKHPIKPLQLLRSERLSRAGGPLPDGKLRWIYGAHHKSGTVLLRGLAGEQAHVMGVEGCYSLGSFGWHPKGCHTNRRAFARVWFRCSLLSPWLADLYEKGVRFRTAHVIRDPIAMVVSGYIYHQKNLRDTPKVLRPFINMSMIDALTAEASFVVNGSGKAMVETFLHSPHNSLQIRLEDFTSSSSSFDETAQVLYDHMAGDLLNASQRIELMARASKHDLRRGGNFSTTHISDPNRTAEVRKVVDQLSPAILSKLKEMRRTLGYE